MGWGIVTLLNNLACASREHEFHQDPHWAFGCEISVAPLNLEWRSHCPFFRRLALWSARLWVLMGSHNLNLLERFLMARFKADLSSKSTGCIGSFHCPQPGGTLPGGATIGEVWPLGRVVTSPSPHCDIPFPPHQCERICGRYMSLCEYPVFQ